MDKGAKYKMIQWNLNGFYTHISNLQILIQCNQTEVTSLQETHATESKPVKLKGYTVYAENRENNPHASGGVAILVKNNIFSN